MEGSKKRKKKSSVEKPRYYYYLAYGSNINMEQMAMRCREATPVGKAMLKNWRLMFRGSKTGSYLTIEKDSNAETPVVVWKVSLDDVEALNRYEGYPLFYDIKIIKGVEVESLLGDKTKLDCFVYVMNKGSDFGMPTPRYYDRCYQGYKRFGLDIKYLDEAMDYTRQNMVVNELEDVLKRRNFNDSIHAV